MPVSSRVWLLDIGSLARVTPKTWRERSTGLTVHDVTVSAGTSFPVAFSYPQSRKRELTHLYRCCRRQAIVSLSWQTTGIVPK